MTRIHQGTCALAALLLLPILLCLELSPNCGLAASPIFCQLLLNLFLAMSIRLSNISPSVCNLFQLFLNLLSAVSSTFPKFPTVLSAVSQPCCPLVLNFLYSQLLSALSQQSYQLIPTCFSTASQLFSTISLLCYHLMLKCFSTLSCVLPNCSQLPLKVANCFPTISQPCCQLVLTLSAVSTLSL